MIYRVAILGGGIGQKHLAGFLASPTRFRVQTICDLNPDVAKPMAERCDAHVTDDIDSVLADPEIDIVDICLPPVMHAPIAIRALEAGKHVIVEKPIAGSLVEADRIAAAEAASGKRVFPVFQYRFGRAFEQLSALKAAGLLGDPQVATLETHWNRKANYYANPWRGTWAHELGGAVLSHAIHIHDLLGQVFGPVSEVSAMLATRANPVATEDCGAMSFVMQNGALVTSSITLGAPTDSSRLRLVFSGLSAESARNPYAPGEQQWRFIARDTSKQKEIDDTVASVPQVKQGFVGFCAAIADALDGADSNAIGLEDGIKALELATAIYHSDRSGTRVQLPLSRDLEIARSLKPDLNAKALVGYRGPARLPQYDRDAVTPGIVHLGIGHFHRAHQAAYVDSLLEQDPSWGIRAISLQTPRTRDLLKPQDWVYTLAERDGDGVSTRVIGSVLSVECGHQAALDAMSDPAIRLITLTVTEKGYTPELGALITEALGVRARNGAGPVTILSCDNLSGNGQVIERRVRAAIRDMQTKRYVDKSVSFPSSMVDRITPAATEADRRSLAEITGFKDAAPVVTEPFSQWVIEDRFAGPRPDLPGVEWVRRVDPYETAKLWLLNGAHTTLALLGPILGHTHVSDAIADPVLLRLVDQTARRDVMPGLALKPKKLEPYWERLLQRFANPGLQHELAQIAMDSSQKVPQRLLAPLLAAHKAKRDAPGLVLGIAAWLAYLRRAARAGETVQDPLADDLRDLADLAPDAALMLLCAPGEPLADLPEDLAAQVVEHLLRIDDATPEELEQGLITFCEGRDA
ncbi:MAG: Gfo/Idh/MocA family oxidoreductase [Marinibacterium sp.]|nr:Gfo/Idh/MocA family oxidoreductase [Marinibacterium sp.]